MVNVCAGILLQQAAILICVAFMWVRFRGTKNPTSFRSGFLVPVTGIEPVRFLRRGILSPLCLPIPPCRRAVIVAHFSSAVKNNRRKFFLLRILTLFPFCSQVKRKKQL